MSDIVILYNNGVTHSWVSTVGITVMQFTAAIKSVTGWWHWCFVSLCSIDFISHFASKIRTLHLSRHDHLSLLHSVDCINQWVSFQYHVFLLWRWASVKRVRECTIACIYLFSLVTTLLQTHWSVSIWIRLVLLFHSLFETAKRAEQGFTQRWILVYLFDRLVLRVLFWW